jgi:hypothetical protein
MSGTLSGDWLRQDNKIVFLNALVNLDEISANMNNMPTEQGKPLSSFYGYLFTGNAGDISWDENSNTSIWNIIRLTKDSLIVNFDGKILQWSHSE